MLKFSISQRHHLPEWAALFSATQSLGGRFGFGKYHCVGDTKFRIGCSGSAEETSRKRCANHFGKFQRILGAQSLLRSVSFGNVRPIVPVADHGLIFKKLVEQHVWHGVLARRSAKSVGRRYSDRSVATVDDGRHHRLRNRKQIVLNELCQWDEKRHDPFRSYFRLPTSIWLSITAAEETNILGSTDM